MNINEVKKIHFIGIGGIGMSGLARLMMHEGKVVSGSDRAPSAITKALRAEGTTTYDTQGAENIAAQLKEGIDLVVYTEAMAKDHPEMVAAREAGIPMQSYFETLGTIANEYYLIVVAGTHGKTTTTAMTIDIFEDAGLDPTAIVGSLRSRTGSNYRSGKSKYFIVEACEYCRDFLSFTPDVLAITNIEAEHLDYYRDLADVQSAFRELAGQVRAGGVVIANVKDAALVPVLDGAVCDVVDYTQYLDLNLSLKNPGMHNRMNAAVATAIAQHEGIAREDAANALADFAGTWRRFEYKGEMATGAIVYDDYAHHPTEIRATIASAREKYPDKRVVAVFQPHLYSRTAELFDDFVIALAKADCVLLAPIYDARDTGKKEGVSSEALAEAVVTAGADAKAYGDFDSIQEALGGSTSGEDVVLVLGAGDITNLARELTN